MKDESASREKKPVLSDKRRHNDNANSQSDRCGVASMRIHSIASAYNGLTSSLLLVLLEC